MRALMTSLHGSCTGSAAPYALIADRPKDAGGDGLGFNGRQLLNLEVTENSSHHRASG
jgi:hypothetical protein